jgi:hypothetical protein
MSDTTGDAVVLPTTPSSETPQPSTPSDRLPDGRFAPGHSGISSGRTPGARNRATIAALSLMDDKAEAMSDKMVTLAMGGDRRALKFCLERVVPRGTTRPVAITMPTMTTIADVATAQSALIDAMACGDINPNEAKTMATVLEMKRKSIESVELEARMVKLEEKHAADAERARRRS